MKYCVLYLNTWNVNLIKEMGMMPYKLHKLFGYNSKIACYNLDDYNYLKNEVKGLEIDFVSKKFNNYTLDGIKYLKENSKDIDILQIFHVTLYSVFYAFYYKKLNPNGKIYLKLDCSYKLIDKINSLNKIKKKFLNLYLDKVDLISAEQKKICNQLKCMLPNQKNKIINIPDGVDYTYLKNHNINYDFSKKENIILNVARIGAEEKNTQMLLEAFKKIKNVKEKGWKLILIGPIQKEFKEYINKFFKENPSLIDIIEFKGEIKDRETLFNYYKKAKIFCLTSEFESFGISFVEAASLGDVIISTNVGIAQEIVSECGGQIVKKGDINALTNAFDKFLNIDNLEKYSNATYKFCYENFNWDNIIKNLNLQLKDLF